MDKLLLEYTNTEPTESRSNQDIIEMLNRRENKGIDDLTSSTSPRIGDKRKGLDEMETGNGTNTSYDQPPNFGTYSGYDGLNMSTSVRTLGLTTGPINSNPMNSKETNCSSQMSQKEIFENSTSTKNENSTIDDLESIIRSNDIINHGT